MKRVAIIIVNWNGWRHTCECLQSFSLPTDNAHIFIVDNHSEDGSANHILKYAEENGLPVKLLTWDCLLQEFCPGHAISIISSDANQGFAKANNAVLRFVLDTSLFEYAWLLNNDTVINSRSLPALLEASDRRPATAFWGSVILDYYASHTIQCCGVGHFKYLGLSKLSMKGKRREEIINRKDTGHRKNSYQNGASLFIRLSAIEEVGLMDENFFLYSEEAEWQLRAARKGFDNQLCLDSVVYHKGRVSTVGRKHIFFFHYNRSAIFMTRKLFGVFASLTSTIALIMVTVGRSRMNPKSVASGLRGISEGWKIKLVPK